MLYNIFLFLLIILTDISEANLDFFANIYTICQFFLII